MMPTTKLSTSISPKGVKFLEVCAAMYNKAQLSDEVNGPAQTLNQNGEFPKKLFALIQECSFKNQYVSQVVKSDYTYPPEFRRKSEGQQIVDLAKAFSVDPTSALKYLETVIGTSSNLPSRCHKEDGLYAIVSPFGFQNVISGYKNPFDDELYCKSLLLIFEKLSKQRSFYNYRDGEINKDHLRQTQNLLEFYEILATSQGKSPIWLIEAQLGFYHKGESVNRARELYLPNEHGLGSVGMGSIALNDSKRFVRWEELDVDCAGDEFSPDADGVFSWSPYFYFDSAVLRFGTDDVSDADGDFGAASAFVPQ